MKIISTKTIHNPKKWLILTVMVAIPFMVTLDSTIVNVALPDMARDLSVSLQEVQTIVSFYLVAVVSSILIFGRLGDMFGKGRLFMLGIVLFGLGSLFSALSPNYWVLNIARVVQGIGGAAAMANNQGIISETFPENERGRALGISGVFLALGTMLGPPLGGLIVSNFHWSYIFFINVPVAVLATVGCIFFLPRGQRKQQTLDFGGAGLMAAFCILLVGTIYRGETAGYGDALVLVGFAISVLFLAVFLFWERRTKQPLLELSLFKNELFTISIFCILIMSIVTAGISILMPISLEDLHSISTQQSGFILMSLSIAMGIISPVGGALSDKFGPGIITLFGLLILLGGVAMLLFVTASTPIRFLVVALVLVGLGAGLFSAPNTALIMSTVPMNKLGIAGSVNGFMRNFGSTLGVSLFSGLLFSFMSSSLSRRVTGFVSSDPGAFVSAWRVVYTVAVVLLVVCILLSLSRIVLKKSMKSSVESELSS